MGRCIWNNVIIKRELPKESEEAKALKDIGLVAVQKYEEQRLDIGHNEVVVGEIIDLGPGVDERNNLAIGQKVLHGKYGGTILDQEIMKAPEGFEYYLLQDKDIIYILEDK